MHNAQRRVTSLKGKNQWQQPCGIARIFQRPVLLAGELQTRQLQGTIEPQWALQASDLGKALLEVHVLHLGQCTVDVQALPFLKQLFAIVIAPTGPAFKVRAMLAEPTLERFPYLVQWLRGIDIGLGYVGQFPSKRCQ